MSNPNGLTDEQIAARPEPYVGMLFWDLAFHQWVTLPKLLFPEGTELQHQIVNEECLLPGEPGCPWPPPPEFRHEWKEGDRAWILWREQWEINTVQQCEMGDLGFRGASNDCTCTVDTPALYIPEAP
jgi:hypothetical protein